MIYWYNSTFINHNKSLPPHTLDKHCQLVYTIVGVASGFIDEKFISFVLQKTVYFLAFAWPIMFKGRPKDVETELSPDIDPEGNDE